MAHGQEGMIDGPQAVAGHNDDLEGGVLSIQLGDQIGDSERLREGDEEAAGAFNEQAIASFFYGFDVLKDFFQRDFAAQFSERHKWSDRFAEIKRIRFVIGQFSRLKRLQESNICARAGAEGFDGQGDQRSRGGIWRLEFSRELVRGRDALPCAEMMKEQGGEDGFADSSVGAGDEDNSFGSAG